MRKQFPLSVLFAVTFALLFIKLAHAQGVGTPSGYQGPTVESQSSTQSLSVSPLSGPTVAVLAYCTDQEGSVGAQNTGNTLQADGRFGSVTLIDGDQQLPTAQFLLDNFAAVIAMTDNRCGIPIPPKIADAAADALTGFAQGGGGVVLSTFGFSHRPTGGIGFGASIFAPGLSPFQQATPFSNAEAGLIDIGGASTTPPCDQLLTSVTSPLSSTYANHVTLSGGATLCASYTNGRPLLAINGSRKVVGLNTFPADESDNAQASYRRLVGNVVFAVAAPSPIITTVAGTGTAGFDSDGPQPPLRQLNFPFGVALDTAGNVYIADRNNHRVRKVDLTGNISTVAGTGVPGFTGDVGGAGVPGGLTAAQFNSPTGVAFDGLGRLLIVESGNHIIRRVDLATNTISTVAGTPMTPGFEGDGGPATSARLLFPLSLAVDGPGNINITDTNNARIRRVDAATDTITTVAGIGVAGLSGDGGLATSAHLNTPTALTVDGAGNIIFSDAGNNRIRKIDTSTGFISTVAGSGTVPTDGPPDVEEGEVVPVPPPEETNTGLGGFAGDGGPATAALLNSPYGVAIDENGNLYIAEEKNHRVRKVDGSTGIISTIAGTGQDSLSLKTAMSAIPGPGEFVEVNESTAGMPGEGTLQITTLEITTGNVFIERIRYDQNDVGMNRFRVAASGRGVDGTTAASHVVGDPVTIVFAGDNGPATAAQLNTPKGLAFGLGKLLIVDYANQRIRQVSLE